MRAQLTSYSPSNLLIRPSPLLSAAYGGMCAQVLSGMVGYVALPAALQLLLEEPALAHGRFGELKHLLLSKKRPRHLPSPVLK